MSVAVLGSSTMTDKFRSGLDDPHGIAEAIPSGVLPDETSISIHHSKNIIRASVLDWKHARPIIYSPISSVPAQAT